MLTTIAIPTYARTALVKEAIWSCLRQSVDVEVVVLNDCPEQVLICKEDRVRCINLPKKYPTLGEKRNALLDYIKTSYVCWLDDDDVLLPWYVEELEALIKDQDEYDLIQPKQIWRLYGEQRNNMKWEVSYAAMPGIAKVEKSRGKFSPLDKGEDKEYRAQLKHCKKETTPGYVYRLTKQIIHASGTSKRTIEEDARLRIKAKQEPRGKIEIEPSMDRTCFSIAPSELMMRLKDYPNYK